MEVSLLTPKCTLVPSNFFDPAKAFDVLSEVADLDEGDEVRYIEIPAYDAVLVYCDNPESSAFSKDNISSREIPMPEMFYILRDLPRCPEYNKILCSWRDGLLFMGIAQGKTLLLSNVFSAKDFTTAQYYIFLSLKSLQLNPEVSTICWRFPVGANNEMSLYRYFKAVEQL